MGARILRARVSEETTLDAFTTPSEGDSPVETIMVWRRSGETCQACGATVERLWRTDGSLVCHECMSWDRG